MNDIKVVNNYRDNEKLRASFNELAKKTFGIDFEDWYQNGYWTDRYNPYSIVMDGKVVANVSVNQTDFEWNGTVKHFIQLGTVMSDREYRNKGLIRKIMEKIDAEYADKVDGMYLFANNNVLDFYPKFGFRAAKQYEYMKEMKDTLEEYEYVKDVKGVSGQTMMQIPMNEKEKWDKIESLINKGDKQSAFDLIDNSQLNMFYVTKYMQNNVYYSEELNAYVVAEFDKDILLIYMVISKEEQDLNRIVDSFSQDIYSVVLGFTPKKTSGFKIREMNQDDKTLHIKGNGFEEFEKVRLMFPLMAHA